MAKISIADKFEGESSTEKPMTRELESHLWLGASDGKARLGEAAEMIEVIKIAPLPSTSATRVRVKIAIIEPVGGDKRVTKIEVEFGFDCNGYSDCIVEALSQRIVLAFQRALGTRMDTLRFQANKLSSILASLGDREQQSDNLGRCNDCGKKMIVPEGGHLECERCDKDNPLCPECGHKTSRLLCPGNYKCLNCGESIGTH